MSLEKNKAIIRRLIEVENKKDLSLLDEFIAPDYVDPILQIQDREGYKQLDTNVFNAFPDWHTTIEGIIAEGDKVWVHFKSTGTNTGEYSGNLPLIGKITLAPTGNKITLHYIIIWRIADGKIVEKDSAVYDLLDFYKQLGVIEYKGFPDEVK